MYGIYMEGLIHKEYFGSHADPLKLFHGNQEAQECHRSETSRFIQKTVNLDYVFFCIKHHAWHISGKLDT